MRQPILNKPALAMSLLLLLAALPGWSQQPMRLTMQLGPQFILLYGDSLSPSLGGSLLSFSLEYFPEGIELPWVLSLEGGLEYHIYTLGSRLDLTQGAFLSQELATGFEIRAGMFLSEGLSFHRPWPLFHFSPGILVGFNQEWIPGHRISLNNRVSWLMSPSYQEIVPGWQEIQYQVLLGYSLEL